MCIVQTEWMKKALERDTGLRGERVARISPDIPDLSGYVREDKGVNNRFFYPASLILYKNHDLIEEARRILENEGTSCEVIYTKDKVLKREEVFEEYNRSTLLFPSYIETFGMPLAEAVQFGCVILAADTEFAKEVLCGYDKAYYFDPFNAGELAELMRKVIKGDIVRGAPKKVMETDSSYSRIVRMIKDAKG